MTLVPGLRLQNYWLDNEPYQSVEPRVAADFHLQKGNSPLTMKTGVGLFSQAAPEVERAIAAVEGLTLPIQKSVQTQLGLAKSFATAWDLRSTLYWIKREEQILKEETFPAPSFSQAAPFTAVWRPVVRDGNARKV